MTSTILSWILLGIAILFIVLQFWKEKLDNDEDLAKERELSAAYKKQQDLQEELNRHVTGGGATPDIQPFFERSGRIGYYISNQDKYPIFDISYTTYNSTAVVLNMPEDKSNLRGLIEANTYYKNHGNLGSNKTFLAFSMVPSQNVAIIELHVNVNWRYGGKGGTLLYTRGESGTWTITDEWH
jgi:hypothetical protein